MSDKETIASMGIKLQCAKANRNAALEENAGLITVIKIRESQLAERDVTIYAKEAVIASLKTTIAERDALLRELQWSSIYSYCTGWNCCPICNGIQPPQGILNGELPNNSGHRTNCKIRKAIGEGKSD